MLGKYTPVVFYHLKPLQTTKSAAGTKNMVNASGLLLRVAGTLQNVRNIIYISKYLITFNTNVNEKWFNTILSVILVNADG